MEKKWTYWCPWKTLIPSLHVGGDSICILVSLLDYNYSVIKYVPVSSLRG